MNYVIGILIAIVALWIALVVALIVIRPKDLRLGDAARLMPDLLRLIAALARDGALPRRTRAWLWILLGYLASPIDIIPDFIPVIGFADDVIIAYLVLRHVFRVAGAQQLEQHWKGTPEGLTVVRRFLGVPTTGD
jgi:uncharacterized membrane protein YkvA (DUF1232 family)